MFRTVALAPGLPLTRSAVCHHRGLNYGRCARYFRVSRAEIAGMNVQAEIEGLRTHYPYLNLLSFGVRPPCTVQF